MILTLEISGEEFWVGEFESRNLSHASLDAPVTIVSEGRSASIEMQHKPEFGPQRIPIEGL